MFFNYLFHMGPGPEMLTSGVFLWFYDLKYTCMNWATLLWFIGRETFAVEDRHLIRFASGLSFPDLKRQTDLS